MQGKDRKGGRRGGGRLLLFFFLLTRFSLPLLAGPAITLFINGWMTNKQTNKPLNSLPSPLCVCLVCLCVKLGRRRGGGRALYFFFLWTGGFVWDPGSRPGLVFCRMDGWMDGWEAGKGEALAGCFVCWVRWGAYHQPFFFLLLSPRPITSSSYPPPASAVLLLQGYIA